jgi:hypothetical protein
MAILTHNLDSRIAATMQDAVKRDFKVIAEDVKKKLNAFNYSVFESEESEGFNSESR